MSWVNLVVRALACLMLITITAGTGCRTEDAANKENVPEAEIASDCTMNGRGEGTCSFTNASSTAGFLCGRIVLKPGTKMAVISESKAGWKSSLEKVEASFEGLKEAVTAARDADTALNALSIGFYRELTREEKGSWRSMGISPPSVMKRTLTWDEQEQEAEKTKAVELSIEKLDHTVDIVKEAANALSTEANQIDWPVLADTAQVLRDTAKLSAWKLRKKESPEDYGEVQDDIVKALTTGVHPLDEALASAEKALVDARAIASTAEEMGHALAIKSSLLCSGELQGKSTVGIAFNVPAVATTCNPQRYGLGGPWTAICAFSFVEEQGSE